MKLNYAFNLTRSFYNYHTRKQKPGNYPMIQDIEVTNACNLNCVFCERERIRGRGIGYITKETWSNIFREENKRMLRHTRLFMHGEPLLHPDIVELVRKAKHFSKTVGFTSNATLLTRELSADLLDAGLTTVCFSFEGTSKQAYESLRTRANFETTEKNILSFLTENKKRGNPCQATLAIINHPTITRDVPAFVQKWNKHLNVTVLQLHDWGLTGKREHICLWPWWGMAVYWNGDVASCCLSESPKVLGNVNRSSLTEIWSSTKYQQFRLEMLDGSACATCALSNRTFIESYMKVTEPSQLGFIKNVCGLAKKAVGGE